MIAAILAEEFQIMEEPRLNIITEPGEIHLPTIHQAMARLIVETTRNKTDRAHGVLRATIPTPITRRIQHHREATARIAVAATTAAVVAQEAILHHRVQEATAEAEAETNGDSKTIVHET